MANCSKFCYFQSSATTLLKLFQKKNKNNKQTFKPIHKYNVRADLTVLKEWAKVLFLDPLILPWQGLLLSRTVGLKVRKLAVQIEMIFSLKLRKIAWLCMIFISFHSYSWAPSIFGTRWFGRCYTFLSGFQLPWLLSTIMLIIFWDILMFDQIFLSPQVEMWLLVINMVCTNYLTSSRTNYDLES